MAGGQSCPVLPPSLAYPRAASPWCAKVGIPAFGLGLDSPDRCSWPLLPAASPIQLWNSRAGMRAWSGPSCVPCQETSYSCCQEQHLELAAAGGDGIWGGTARASGSSRMLPTFLGRCSWTGKSCQERGGAPTPGLCQLPPRCHPQPGRDPWVPINSRAVSLATAVGSQLLPSQQSLDLVPEFEAATPPHEKPVLPLCPLSLQCHEQRRP